MNDWCMVRILGILLGDMVIIRINGYYVGIEDLMEKDNSIGDKSFSRGTLLRMK